MVVEPPHSFYVGVSYSVCFCMVALVLELVTHSGDECAELRLHVKLVSCCQVKVA